MARILGYIATIIDGFIASWEERLDWLFKYDGMDLGEHDYVAFLRTHPNRRHGSWHLGFHRQARGPMGLRQPARDIWMLGGGRLQMAVRERGALDEIEIYVIPEIIGGGHPLFPATGFRSSSRLIDARAVDRGCVRLHYVFDAADDDPP